VTRCALILVVLAALFAGGGCQKDGGHAVAASKQQNALLESRVARLDESLAAPESEESNRQPIARWLLPRELAEISGLALTPDERLFAHNDETAHIVEIDYRRGTITKDFVVGSDNFTADFEGLTYAKDRFFLLSSDGVLYEFPEGTQGERVDAEVHDTRLGKECEFESIAYDPNANAVILACKNTGDKRFSDMLVLYRYHLGDGTETQLTIPQSKVSGENNWKRLRPTDITVDPSTGNYVLVSAQERALVGITPSGEVVFSEPLEGQHPQAEGIAITRDHILIISDELTTRAATLTLYRWP
jgi:uncharacterized protein YjiK